MSQPSSLLQFVEKFKEVKELSRQPSVTKLHPQSNGTGDNNHVVGDAILSNGPVVAPPGVATKPPQVRVVWLLSPLLNHMFLSMIILLSSVIFHILFVFRNCNYRAQE